MKPSVCTSSSYGQDRSNKEVLPAPRLLALPTYVSMHFLNQYILNLRSAMCFYKQSVASSFFLSFTPLCTVTCILMVLSYFLCYHYFFYFPFLFCLPSRIYWGGKKVAEQEKEGQKTVIQYGP